MASQADPQADLSDHATPRTGHVAEGAIMAGAIATVWMVQQPYEGFHHDSQLYTLQALARLRPDLLGNDLFLRFGSQDSFTIFGPLYAASIDALDVDTAAAALTFITHAAFFSIAWVLARAVMSARFAWLAVGLLAALPGDYGGRGVFQYVESFITPRMAAEALTLAALAALILRRHAIAGLCILAAALIHPLMAAAGVAAGAFLLAPAMRIRAAWVFAALLAAPLVLASFAHIGANPRFDPEWRTFLQIQSPYLFLADWRLKDWVSTSVPLATLLVGALLPLSDPARALCRASLLAALAGCALAAIGSDALGMVLIAQAQPWRWLWLASVVAVLLIPAIGAACWHGGRIGLSVALLLLGAWLCQAESFALLLASLAAVLAFVSRRAPDAMGRYERAIFMGSVLAASICLLISLANNLIIAQSTPDQSIAPGLMKAVRTMTRDGVVACLVLVAVWWVVTRQPVAGQPAAARTVLINRVAASLVVATAFLATARVSATEWAQSTFSQAAFDAFAPWRERIPPGEEVLWLGGHMPTWTLLRRPSYISAAQIAAALFSREAALELKRRAGAVTPFMRNEGFVPFLEASGAAKSAAGTDARLPDVTLADTCARTNVKFVVTKQDLHAPALDAAPTSASRAYRSLRLYGCAPGRED